MIRPRRVLIGFVVAAVAGIGIFLTLAWGATTVERAPADVAAARFDDVRRVFGDEASLLVRRPDGTIARRPEPPARRAGELSQLAVLAYDARSERLVEVGMPFWFFKLKAPAAQFAVRGTGFDLDSLGVTAADLEAQGPCIVFDESTPTGNRLLIWTK